MILNHEPKLKKLDRPGHPDGMTVPEGFFEQFNAKMAASLPPNALEQQPAEALKPRTTWQKLRPFVYMAAMFAGIWCMMKMFTLMQHTPATFPQPSTYADAMITASADISADELASYYDYIVSDYSESDLLEDLYTSGYEPASFQL